MKKFLRFGLFCAFVFSFFVIESSNQGGDTGPGAGTIDWSLVGGAWDGDDGAGFFAGLPLAASEDSLGGAAADAAPCDVDFLAKAMKDFGFGEDDAESKEKLTSLIQDLKKELASASSPEKSDQLNHYLKKAEQISVQYAKFISMEEDAMDSLDQFADDEVACEKIQDILNKLTEDIEELRF